MNLTYSYYSKKTFYEVFILVQFSSYFNAAMEQKQDIIVTQVNPAPLTVIPEGLFNLKETSGLCEPFDLRSKLTRAPGIELG